MPRVGRRRVVTWQTLKPFLFPRIEGASRLGAVDAVIAWNEPTLQGPGSEAAIAGILERLVAFIEAPTDRPRDS